MKTKVFKDQCDLLGLTQCRVASNFSVAEYCEKIHILHNILVSYLTSYVKMT